MYPCATAGTLVKVLQVPAGTSPRKKCDKNHNLMKMPLPGNLLPVSNGKFQRAERNRSN